MVVHRKWGIPSVRSIATVAAGLLAAIPATGTTVFVSGRAASQEGSPASCEINGPTGAVRHVVSLVFDNVHFRRDNPNVPSDLEQMPNLLNFIKQNGVLLSNMHTPLISHTADDILTTLTGVYGDRHGQPVSNSYRVYNTNGSSTGAVSFAYWTDPVANFSGTTTTDTSPTMIDKRGKIAPAPWVPFTRAGCDVGGFSTANIEVENADPDLKSIYGVNTPQWQSVLAHEANNTADVSNADYQGIAVHCAKTSTSVCARNPSLVAADRLPDEPGGYNGYHALFGNLNVAPAIGGGPKSGFGGVCVNDLGGTPLTNADASGETPQFPKGYCGFPGFDPSASQTLAYVADMQESGIPVTYAYIRDAHGVGGAEPALGPGDPTYVQQLKDFDTSFGQWFTRLQNDGITPQNTLFMVSTDEGDHFAGTQHPTPAGCNGVTTPCTYAKGSIGEVSLGLAGLLKEQNPSETSGDYQIHSDSAPNFWVNGNPDRTAARVRQLEHEMAALLAPDPYANNGGTKATIPVTQFLADSVEETILHMRTADPNRLPTFTDFANPDFFIFKGGTTCSGPSPSQTGTTDPCVNIDPNFAWNHGDVQHEITNNWAAIVGPGVTARGVDSSTWADETDMRPTMMALVGLEDDYIPDGRVLIEELSHSVLPSSVHDTKRFDDLIALDRAYKQLDADVGVFGLETLQASTTALESSDLGDATYSRIDGQLASIGDQRDDLASTIRTALNGVEFEHATLNTHDAEELTSEANALIVQAGQIG